jgi:four helix bundle protein
MARTYRELVAWQLAEELRELVVAETAMARAAGGWRFCDQARDAAASVSANIAEGFGRDSAAEFARFLGYALGSLAELETHLRDAVARGHMLPARAATLLRLRARCETAAIRLRANRKAVAEEARRRAATGRRRD